MANVNIAEFSGLASVKGGQPVVAAPPLTVQNVAIGGSSVPSAAFAAGTSIVRVQTDAIAWIAFGANPVAVASGSDLTTVRLPANTTEFFGVPGGSKIAVITGA